MLENPTYGAELEVCDYNALECESALVELGAQRNNKDTTIINSSGVANDPSLRTCIFGGEINTKPTDTLQEQLSHIQKIHDTIEPFCYNHSSNLHLHLGFPGLENDLSALKKINAWLFKNLPYIQQTYIFPEVLRQGQVGIDNSKIRKSFLKRRKISRGRLISEIIYNQQLKTNSPKEFYDANRFKNAKGEYVGYTFQRPFINFYQLWQSGTIEFRCFSSTKDLSQIEEAFKFCLSIIDCINQDRPAETLREFNLPKGSYFDLRTEELGALTKIHIASGTSHISKKLKLQRNAILKELLAQGTITQGDLGIDLSVLDCTTLDKKNNEI